jgi:hypothetical protein
VSMLGELKECDILKLVLIVIFACVTLDVGHRIYCEYVRDRILAARDGNTPEVENRTGASRKVY